MPPRRPGRPQRCGGAGAILYDAVMRIAQLAPPWITVPPAGYGGTEWVVQQLCDGLVARGHEVVLYAAGDSRTSAELRALFPAQMPEVLGQSSYDARHVSFAFADIERDGFDLIHDHSGFLGIAFGRYLRTPMLHTVHCAFDTTAYGFYEQFKREVGYIGISEYQQSMGPPGMNWAGLVYNAIAVEEWPYTPAMMSLWPVRLAASMDRWKPLASHTLPKASRYSSFFGVYGHCSTAMAL
jgi:glycosyltransferase involved in cell wall biosynthesis